MADSSETSSQEPLSVYTVIVAMTEQMSSIAWQKLGLQPDIMTGKLVQDLEQAKVAIDLTAEMARFIEPELDEEDRRRIQGMIRDLRLNYVQKCKEVRE
jgi:hypothetical protein